MQSKGTSSKTFATDDRIAFLHIGRGGWTGYHRDVPGSCCSGCTVSHYGDTWREHTFTDDCVAVDTTTVDDDRIVKFAVSGPMYSPNVPAGHVWKVGTYPRNAVAWEDDGSPFGNAGGFDTVAVDVYVMIARRFGATVFDPREARS